jgi:hypothetical protein
VKANPFFSLIGKGGLASFVYFGSSAAFHEEERDYCVQSGEKRSVGSEVGG